MRKSNRSDPGSGAGPPRYPGSFLLAFREAVASLNWQVRRWLGDAVDCLDEAGAEHTVGLENLYRRARREGRDQWPAFIADFLSRIRAAEKAADSPTDLAAIADRLLVRLGQPFTALPNTLKVWSQELAGTGLSINLVIDSAETMSYVTEEMVASSGRPGSEWLERALANLRERTPANCMEVVHEESEMRLCSVGDAYDSSRALQLDSLLPETRSLGCLVAVPSRDELVVLPVALKAVPHFHLLKLLAEKNFKSAPYPITNEVYWVRDGVWQHFPIDIRSNKVAIRPPEEFLEVLNQLAPEDKAADKEQAPEA